MEIPAELASILRLQSSMLLFLGALLFASHFASRRLKTDNGAVWFAAGSVLGSVGLLLQSYGNRLPLAASVMLSNALFLMEPLLLTKAIALSTRQRFRGLPVMVAIALAMLACFGYLSYWHPDRSARVMVGTAVLAVLLLFPVYLLLRCRNRSTRPARRAMAAGMVLVSLGLLERAVAVLRGAQLLNGASWGGVFFIALTAICFLWMDMLGLSCQLEEKAMSDPLTGLLNRRAIDVFARRELARCNRQEQAIAALMIDMNNFKSINDRHGHSTGDAVLQCVAEVIRTSLRGVDMAARIGGDEFLVLLPDASEITVRTVSSRLRVAIAELRVPAPSGKLLQVSASIGQSRSMAGDLTLQDLIEHSDRNMYAQKPSGGQTRQLMHKVELLPMELLRPSRYEKAQTAVTATMSH